ncbi:hypothetical protein [Amycolatopsis benzoatilytica]|uniref:hypothetical protein n=1 Tax=Amycolatopsis benzoatilytica TaxID=346045 RepID=UPI00037D905B|nr:hypothetical protein [Amycolatopsis benzoatilytica]
MTGAHFGEPGVGTGGAAGDAGTDFFSNLGLGLTDHKAAEQVNAGGARLKTLAQNGSFAVNEAGFQAYLNACNFFLDGYNRMSRDVGFLAQAAGMGSSDYARNVADFNVKVADGDASSILPNLDLMRQGILQAREALTIARKNYRETEHAHSVSFADLSKETNGQ